MFRLTLPVKSEAVSFLQPIMAGVLAAVVGFASAFTVVLQGLAGVGATPAEAASGLLAVCVGQGVLGVFLSLRHRQPITIAWSTSGAALLMGTGIPHGGFGVAVSAFLIAGILTVLAGLWRPLARAVAAIPLSLASAMLAGVLMTLCLAPIKAVAHFPELVLPIILAWAVGWCVARRYAVLLAVAVTIIVVFATTTLPANSMSLLQPRIIFVRPVGDLSAAISIAIPLFIVTMASQNLPGMAVLKTNGFKPPVGEIFLTTGLGSLPVALIGGLSLNLSAITAALCAGPEAGPDPQKRYAASMTAGITYIGLGLLAGLAAAFIMASPPLLIQTVAGLALLSSLVAAMTATLTHETHRLAAIVTFITAASGVSILGVGSPLWGLIAGIGLLGLEKAAITLKNRKA